MRKAFRVATVFTGVAAGAAVFTPALAANAATAKPAADLTVIPENLMNCNPNISTTSVHLYWSANEKHPTPTCVGNIEHYTAFGTNVRYSVLCAGNNRGYFISANYSGVWNYSPGEAFNLGRGRAEVINNSGWSGGDTCPG